MKGAVLIKRALLGPALCVWNLISLPPSTVSRLAIIHPLKRELFNPNQVRIQFVRAMEEVKRVDFEIPFFDSTILLSSRCCTIRYPRFFVASTLLLINREMEMEKFLIFARCFEAGWKENWRGKRKKCPETNRSNCMARFRTNFPLAFHAFVEKAYSSFSKFSCVGTERFETRRLLRVSVSSNFSP